MSTKYRSFDEVPTEVLAARLRELSDACKDKQTRDREFTMRVPAEHDRDADLVLISAARRLEGLAREDKPPPLKAWLDISTAPKDGTTVTVYDPKPGPAYGPDIHPAFFDVANDRWTAADEVDTDPYDIDPQMWLCEDVDKFFRSMDGPFDELSRLKEAARRLATEADMFACGEGERDDLEAAIELVEGMTSGAQAEDEGQTRVMNQMILEASEASEEDTQ